MSDWRDTTLAAFDPEVAAAVACEAARQERTIDLIASENSVSRAALEAYHGAVERLPSGDEQAEV